LPAPRKLTSQAKSPIGGVTTASNQAERKIFSALKILVFAKSSTEKGASY
jgi:hypothetical protein